MRKYLIPDSNDEIRQEQMRELELITGDSIIDNLKASQTALLLSPGFANIGYSGQQSGMSNPVLVNTIPTVAQQDPEQTEQSNSGHFKATSSLDNSTLRKTSGPYQIK